MAEHHLDTLVVHAGHGTARPCPVATPIYTSTSYVYDSTEDLDAVFSGEASGYSYSRYGNPTTGAFEEAVAVMEGAEGGVAFASGMAALHGALIASGVRNGDTILAGRDMYGITVQLLNTVMAASGVATVFVDSTSIEDVQAALEEHRPRALLVESMSNPLLKLADIAALSQAARAVDTAVIVDNTFTSPYLLRPHTLGADFVMHSATKYLGGHGDALGGVVTANGDAVKALRKFCSTAGAVLSPFDAALLARGVQTLCLRMERHCRNAGQVAQWLQNDRRILCVHYPSMPRFPQNDLALRLFEGRGFGGIVTFEVRDSNLARTAFFVDSLELALPGPTLGDVATLVMIPAIASHRALSRDQRLELGITDAHVRLSVGIENVEDIIGDLEQALATATQ